eukprot:COSAG06_NODE_74649_length_140_cov_26.878049_1_plen_39_part_01
MCPVQEDQHGALLRTTARDAWEGGKKEYDLSHFILKMYT